MPAWETINIAQNSVLFDFCHEENNIYLNINSIMLKIK